MLGLPTVLVNPVPADIELVLIDALFTVRHAQASVCRLPVNQSTATDKMLQTVYLGLSVLHVCVSGFVVGQSPL